MFGQKAPSREYGLILTSNFFALVVISILAKLNAISLFLYQVPYFLSLKQFYVALPKLFAQDLIFSLIIYCFLAILFSLINPTKETLNKILFLINSVFTIYLIVDLEFFRVFLSHFNPAYIRWL
ncbi:MAG: hypothetical protein ABH950_00760, partial [Candidatus Altiarchaeota archaeon]